MGTSAWAETTTVGADDNSAAWWTAFSDPYTIEPNQTLSISFKNYTSKAGNWCNWIGAVTTDADRGAAGYSEYIILRADNYGWGKSWVFSNLSSYYNWETFGNDMDGATVAMTVARNGAIVTIHADITKAGDSTPSYWEEYWAACGTGTQNIRFFLTTEKGHLTDIAGSTAANGNTSESTGWGTLVAYNDFSNGIVSNSITGEKNSMALTGSRWAKGYTYTPTGESEPVTSLSDVLRVGNGSGTITIPDEELAGDRDEVVISFDYWFGNLSGKYAGFTLYDDSETPVTIASFYRCFFGNDTKENTFGFDASKITVIGSSSVQDDKICVDGNKTRFELHLNYATGKMWALQYTNGAWKQSTTPVDIPTTAGKLKSFAVRSDYTTDGRRCWFDNLMIQNKRGDYSTSEVAYTVKFVDGEGNAVKADDTSRQALAGTSISDLVSADDMTTFYNNGNIATNNTTHFAEATNKYVYKSISAVNSSDESITEIVAGAIVTIVYDKHVKYDYTLKQKLGDAEASIISSSWLWDDETASMYFPKGIKDGDNYYFTEANANSPYFRITLTYAKPTVTLNYVLDPTVVYYSEGEEIESKTGTYTHFQTDMAGGSSGVLNAEEGNLITSLGTGIYTLTARTIGRGNDDKHKIKFYKGNVSDGTILLTASPSNSGNTETSEAFSLTEVTNILVSGAQGGGQNGNGLDYVIIRKYPSSVSCSLGTNGYATFASPYPLDLTSVSAYKAAVSGTTVTFSPLTQTVPANTGFLLKGEAGATVNIPVVAEGTTVAENAFLVNTAGTTFAADADYYYFGLKANTLTFGLFDPAAVAIPANKAYLKVLKTSIPSGARLSVVFDDETTGISTIESVNEVNGCYNINGQRVAQPSKGLYIVNGKKVIIK